MGLKKLAPNLVIRTGIPASEVLEVSKKAASSTLPPMIPLPFLGINARGVVWPYVDQIWTNPVLIETGKHHRDPVGRWIREWVPDWYMTYASLAGHVGMDPCSIRIPYGDEIIHIQFNVTRSVQTFKAGGGVELDVDSSNRCFLYLAANMNTLLPTAKTEL
jgi:hypothetical protein